MTLKRVINIGFLYGAILLFFGVGFFSHCANPASPEGGPKDTLPPKIVNIEPIMFTKNFDAQRITITFDEYVQVTNSQTEILISPEPDIKPTYSVKGKSVIVDLRETTLDSATTYKIDFGLAIKDNNESNPLVNFAYVFSTGEYIDSLAMSGQVIDAFTGDSVFNALVMLFDSSKDTTAVDSVLFRSKPNSITRTDSMGVFLATNLKGIDYRVYAIKEETSDGKYNIGSDKVAFLDSLFNPTTMKEFEVWYNPRRQRIEATPQAVYHLFSEPSPLARQNLKKSSRPARNIALLEFTERDPEILSIVLDSVDMNDVVIKHSTLGDSITIYYPYMENFLDSLRGSISYASVTTDSIPQDTIIEKFFTLGYREVKDKKKKKEDQEEEEVIKNPFKMSFETSRSFNPHGDMVLRFDQPLKVIDSSRIVITKSTSQTTQQEQKSSRGARGGGGAQQAAPTAPSGGATGEKEPSGEEISFNFVQDTNDILVWRIKTTWEDNAKYNVFIPDSVFVDILNQKNDTTINDFTTYSQEKYGLVKIDVEGYDGAFSGQESMRYIVQFIERGQVAYEKSIEGDGRLIFDYIKPSKYAIKVIEDKNFDGKWSEGVLVDKIQPERIAIHRDENGNEVLEVKENWEMEGIRVDLTKLFAGSEKQNDSNNESIEQAESEPSEDNEDSENIESIASALESDIKESEIKK